MLYEIKKVKCLLCVFRCIRCSKIPKYLFVFDYILQYYFKEKIYNFNLNFLHLLAVSFNNILGHCVVTHQHKIARTKYIKTGPIEKRNFKGSILFLSRYCLHTLFSINHQV